MPTTHLKTAPLGSTGLEIARIGFGAWAIGGGRVVQERHGSTAGAVAIAWTLANPAVDGAIVGFRRPDQVDPLIAAAGLELAPEGLTEIAAG